MADYPQRAKHYAHKLVRLMTRVCAAQEIGTDGAWLVTIIAHTEDARHYSGAVTFWNDQLMSVAGFSRGQLERARKKAVDAKWLQYEPGGKGKVGRYFTTVPPEFAGLGDGSTDCDAADLSPGLMRKNEHPNGREAGEKRETSAHLSSLSLSLTGTGAEPEPLEVEEMKPGKPKKIQAADVSTFDHPERRKLEQMRIAAEAGHNGTLKGIPDDIAARAVADWWRVHLSGDPLTGDTALDLLHVLCAAAEVRKTKKIQNRAAKLASLLSSGAWVRSTVDLEANYEFVRRNLSHWKQSA